MKYRFCVLKRKIKRLLNEINYERMALANRSNQYHNGRLNIDSMLEEYTNDRMKKIYQIKRELVKLKQESDANTNTPQ